MIKLTSLNKFFKRNKILKDVSLLLPNQGVIFLLGENGSGKTTLLNILGLLDSHYQGEYIYNGINIKKTDSKTKGKIIHDEISYVFQKGNQLNYLGLHSTAHLDEIIDGKQTILKKDNPLIESSQGQIEMLFLQRSLKSGKKLYLLDEVTSELDNTNCASILNKIEVLSKSALVIMTTHDTRCFSISHSSILLDKGRVVSNDLKDKSFFEENSAQITKSKRVFLPFCLFLAHCRKCLFVLLISFILNTLLLCFGLCGINYCTTSPERYADKILNRCSSISFTDYKKNNLQSIFNEECDEIIINADGHNISALNTLRVAKDGFFHANEYTISKLREYYSIDNYYTFVSHLDSYKIPVILDNDIENDLLLYNGDYSNYLIKDSARYLSIKESYWDTDNHKAKYYNIHSELFNFEIFYCSKSYAQKYYQFEYDGDVPDDTLITSASDLTCSEISHFQNITYTKTFDQLDLNDIFPHGVKTIYEDFAINSSRTIAVVSDMALSRIQDFFNQFTNFEIKVTKNNIATLSKYLCKNKKSFNYTYINAADYISKEAQDDLDYYVGINSYSSSKNVFGMILLSSVALLSHCLLTCFFLTFQSMKMKSEVKLYASFGVDKLSLFSLFFSPYLIQVLVSSFLGFILGFSFFQAIRSFGFYPLPSFFTVLSFLLIVILDFFIALFQFRKNSL